MSDMLRVTGMVSGMDTEKTVKELIKVERTKVDKARQDKQIYEWQQDQYRELAATMKSFQTEYLDFTKGATNFRGTQVFNAFNATASTDAVSATTTGRSSKGNIEITSIEQLATKDTYVSGSAVSGNIKGTSDLDAAALSFINAETENRTLTFNLDGQTKTIELANNYTDANSFVDDINTKLTEKFPSTTVKASLDGGKLSFSVQNGGAEEAGHKLSVNSANTAVADKLGFPGGSQNYTNTSQKLSDFMGASADVALTINGKSDFGITSEDTIEKAMSKINNSDAGVKISYDDFTDTFKLESTKEGAANSIAMSDTDGFLGALKLTEATANHSAAQDAIFTVKTDSGEVRTTRSSNTATIEGTKLTFNKTSTQPITVGIKPDTENVKKNILKFVESYNKMVKAFDDKINERRYRSFAPLTSEQKKELEEEDEKNWQDKAKSGLLKDDYVLKNIGTKMRQALYEKVESSGLSLTEIGITTASYFDEGGKWGKLVVDEDKLDKALTEKPDEVAKLFNAKSDEGYRAEGADSAKRYKESGLAERINDIINDNIRTGAGDNKGYLIKKAGQKNKIDASSDLYKKIKQSDEKIDKLLELLSEKEDKYYNQFARMEAVMQKYNAQSSYFSGMM